MSHVPPNTKSKGSYLFAGGRLSSVADSLDLDLLVSRVRLDLLCCVVVREVGAEDDSADTEGRAEDVADSTLFCLAALTLALVRRGLLLVLGVVGDCASTDCA
jgi:hypothetical protein